MTDVALEASLSEMSTLLAKGKVAISVTAKGICWRKAENLKATQSEFSYVHCRLPKTAEAVAMSDLGMVFIGEPELVNITLTYIPEEADCVQYVLHACRGKDGKFHALNVLPKVVKTLMFDCLPLHG